MFNIKQYQQAMGMSPDVPGKFHNAMCSTLDGIVAREAYEQMNQERPMAGRRNWQGRRTLAFALLIALLLGAVAFAAYQWHIFDTLSFMTGPAPKNADQVMQSGLAQTTVHHVDITILEAGYDGRTLFIRYSYRMKDVDTPLGMYRTGETGEGIAEEDMQLLYDHGVGWWIDQLWINGQAVDMPGNSGSVTSGSKTPGEIIQDEYWRLDNEAVQLSGQVEIGLPIGERQSLDEYRKNANPDKYDESGKLKQPDKGIVTFTLDTADTLAKVRVEHPNVAVKTPEVTAQVTEVCYSPMMTYLTLSLEGNPDAIAAYKAENGEGFYGEDGKLLWEYGGADVFGGWVASLELVDGNGKQLFPGVFGNNGCGNEWAEFVYPHIENLPEELYLAPMEDGVADMTVAIKVK